jgi:hypothetical protein
MKVRQGFVSNSSSSSFMICLRKEDYKEVFNSLSKLEQELVKHLHPIDKKVFGLDLKIISGTSGNYDSFEDFVIDIDLTDEEEERLDDDGAACIFDDVYKKFEAKEHFQHGVDF